MEDKTLVSIDKLAVDINIDKNDVVSLAVAKAEETIVIEIKACELELKETNESIKASLKHMNDMRQAAIDLRFGGAIKKLKRVCQEVGFRSCRIETNFEKAIDIREKGSYHQDNYDQGLDSTFEVHVKMWNNQDRYSDNMKFKDDIEVESPTQYKGYVSQLKKFFDNRKATSEDLIDWKRKKANIGSLERMYRGRLAEGRLKSTKGGKELMALLTKSIENDIKLLG